MSVSFGGTITSGIQDISALLPLLGTEQCEKRAGIALEKGFLYAAATPLSLFGSLGIVKAALPILLATLRFHRLGFIGAKKLNDAGFTLSGSVAPLIGVDPDLPTRYLAESRLIRILDENSIRNYRLWNLRIKLEVWKWNMKLVASSIIASLLGIVPYLYLNLAGTTMRRFLAWTFPALRIGASYLCCITIQLILQNRITSLIQQRIVVQFLDSLPESDIDYGELTEALKNLGTQWDLRHDAESRITSLRNAVHSSDHVDDIIKHQIDFLHRLEGAPGRIRWQESEMYLIVLQVILFLSSIGVVIGYIGCFTVAQAATSPYGPLSWLCLEAGLSLIRVAIWAWNPEWDDIEGGFRLVLEIPSYSPSSLSPQKLEHSDGQELYLPAKEHSQFWEGLEPYTGPLPLFSHSGYDLYLTLGEFEEKNGFKSTDFCATVVHDRAKKAIFVRHSRSGGLLGPVFVTVPESVNNDHIDVTIPGTFPDMINAKYCDENVSEFFPIPLIEDVHVHIVYITHLYATLLVVEDHTVEFFFRPIVTGWTITPKRVSSEYVTYIKGNLLSAEDANRTQRARWTRWMEEVSAVIMREERADISSSDWHTSSLPTARLLLQEASVIELHYLEWLADAEKSLSVRQNAFLDTIYGWEEKNRLQDEWRHHYNLRLREDAQLATDRLAGCLSTLHISDDYNHLMEECRAILFARWEKLLDAKSDYSAVKDHLRREREKLTSSITSDTAMSDSDDHTNNRLRRRIERRLQMAEYWMRFFFNPVSSRFDKDFKTHYGLNEVAFPFLAEIMYSHCIKPQSFSFLVLWPGVSSWLQGPEGERFLSKAFKLRKDLGLDTMYMGGHHEGWFNILEKVLDSEVTVTMPEQDWDSLVQVHIPGVTAGSWKTMIYFTGEPSHEDAPRYWEEPLLFIPLHSANHNSAIVEINSKSEAPMDLSLIILHRNPTERVLAHFYPSPPTTDPLKVSVMRSDTDAPQADLDVPPPDGASVMVAYRLPDIKKGNTKVTLTPKSWLWEVRYIKVVASKDVNEWIKEEEKGEGEGEGKRKGEGEGEGEGKGEGGGRGSNGGGGGGGGGLRRRTKEKK